MRTKISGGRIAIYVAFWLFGVVTGSSWLPVLLTLPTFLLILVRIGLHADEKFTLTDMFWFMALLFFVVSPCQVLTGDGMFQNIWTKFHYSLDILIKANAIVFLSLFVVFVFRSAPSRTAPFVDARRPLGSQGCLVFLALSLGALLLYIWGAGGFVNIMLPTRLKSDENTIKGAGLFLAMQGISTLFLAINSAHPVARDLREKMIAYGTLAFALIGLAISINPINNPRFVLISFWLPILAVLFRKMNRYRLAYGTFLIGLLVIMPILTITTRVGLEGIALIGTEETSPFKVGDIDVLDMLAHAVYLKQSDELNYGSNTVAIALFFVPRNFWPSKPIVGGLIVGNDMVEKRGAGTSNLSQYIAGDFYMDFGFLGVLVGFILLAIVRKFFVRYRVAFLDQDLIDLLSIFSLPILMRGPVGATAGYFVSSLAVATTYAVMVARQGRGSERARPLRSSAKGPARIRVYRGEDPAG